MKILFNPAHVDDLDLTNKKDGERQRTLNIVQPFDGVFRDTDLIVLVELHHVDEARPFPLFVCGLARCFLSNKIPRTHTIDLGIGYIATELL